MISFNEKYASSYIDGNKTALLKDSAEAAFSALCNKDKEGNDFLGWFDLPIDYDKDEVKRIEKAAKKIIASSDALIVIGIGGSYLGARAAVDFLKTPYYNQLDKNTPDIYFLGNSFSGEEMEAVFAICKNKRVSVNVISKSGTTTEPAIAFRKTLEFMLTKYTEEELKDRIFCTTDAVKGALHDLAVAKGYERFVVPDNVGGRFSVFTAVGLLPLACCGCDINAMIEGTASEREKFLSQGVNHPACRYALIRKYFLAMGKSSELIVSYDPFLRSYAEWWKQLFGESEGKDGKGIYPTGAVFSTDLHSLGQYVQDGMRILFETVLKEKNPDMRTVINSDAENLDGLNYIAGKTLAEVNATAAVGTALAHTDGGVPVLEIEFDKKDEKTFGELCWFFFASCGVSAYMLGVNPFNQPGVEAYKKNMFALLGKQGYEELRQKLLKSM